MASYLACTHESGVDISIWPFARKWKKSQFPKVWNYFLVVLNFVLSSVIFFSSLLIVYKIKAFCLGLSSVFLISNNLLFISTALQISKLFPISTFFFPFPTPPTSQRHISTTCSITKQHSPRVLLFSVTFLKCDQFKIFLCATYNVNADGLKSETNPSDSLHSVQQSGE